MSKRKITKTLEAPETLTDVKGFESKGRLTLVDDVNLKIIEELVKNPSTSSASLATKLGMPLSSLQRRRTKLEKALLVKTYHINLKHLEGKWAI